MRKIAGWLLLLSLLGAGVYWLLAQQQAANESPQPTVTRSQLAPEATQRLEEALNSTDPAKQAEVLSQDLAKAHIAHGGQFLPEGASIQLKPETFAMASNAARIDAELKMKDRSNVIYELILIRADTGDWKILNTERK